MKTLFIVASTAALAWSTVVSSAADPRTSSWLTQNTSRYARIYVNDAAKNSGTAVTTWSNGSQVQSTPAYAGVQAVYSSPNWVYIRSSGLAQHIMGPWLNGMFPNLPKNQNALYRIPRVPSVPQAKTLTGLGTIGYFVDGVSMFDTRDGFFWNGASESGGGGTGYWNRDAYVNEGATFDPGYAHQENTGNHHYHANPIALRYLLGDHVDYNPTTRTYSESTGPIERHSPILGWVRDGFPIYGPYGYSSASNATTGVRRMISGFVLRNGQNGTDNLQASGRTTLPDWAVRAYNVSAAQSGPTNTTYPLGRYMEDKAYLGDLTNSNTGQRYVQGVDFDLDEYNGRWCVTPEFPQGTYAYFVSISVNGTPVFPYNIGRAYYGSPTGSSATLSEAVETNFVGGASIRETLNAPVRSGNNVVLTWSGVEGATYRVEAQSVLTGSNWDSVATNSPSGTSVGTATEIGGMGHSARFYRVVRTALASYDGGTGGGTGGSTIPVPGGTVSLGNGTNVNVAITLTGTPPNPPAGAPVQSVTLAGSIVGVNTAYAVQGTVTTTFPVPENAQLGAQTVIVTFSPPPGQQNGPAYTFTGGLTIVQ